jgi:CRP/FNR family cyclic AMP-dependent transcriptional regulator
MISPDIFNDVPIFALLDAEEREVLAQQVSKRDIAHGQVLYQAGEPGTHAYLVQRGRVNVTLTDIAGEVINVDVSSRAACWACRRCWPGPGIRTRSSC